MWMTALSARHLSLINVYYVIHTFSPPELEHQPPTPFRRGTVPFIPVSGTSQDPHQGIRLLQLSPDPHHCQGQDASGKRPHRRQDPGLTPRHGHQQDHPTYRFATGTEENSDFVTQPVKKGASEDALFLLSLTIRKGMMPFY